MDKTWSKLLMGMKIIVKKLDDKEAMLYNLSLEIECPVCGSMSKTKKFGTGDLREIVCDLHNTEDYFVQLTLPLSHQVCEYLNTITEGYEGEGYYTCRMVRDDDTKKQG